MASSHQGNRHYKQLMFAIDGVSDTIVPATVRHDVAIDPTYLRAVPHTIGLRNRTIAQAKRKRRRAARQTGPQTKNIENNPMHSNRGRRHGCFSLQKHFDTSGKSPAHFQHRANFHYRPSSWPDGSFGAITGQTPRPLKLHRIASANDRLRVAVPRPLPMRVPEEIST
jgi:hypothetical protein